MDADARLDAAVGSVAEEAARLLEALARPRTTPDAAGHDTDADTDAEPSEPVPDTVPEDVPEPQGEHVHVAMGEAESCTWCPVCRSVTALRGVSPETLARLADLATTAATLLAELASRHTDGTSQPEHATAERTGPPRTEPIAVNDEEDLP